MATKYVTLTGSESGDTIYPNIKSQNIESESINAGEKLMVGSITASRIANGAVQASHLSPGAVQTAAIDGLAVTAGKIANEAVTSAKIKDGEVTAQKLNAFDGTLREYMDDRSLFYNLSDLASTIQSLVRKGYTFYWDEQTSNYTYFVSLIPGVDDDNHVFFMGCKLDESPISAFITERTETILLKFDDDVAVSHFFQDGDGDSLFIHGIE